VYVLVLGICISPAFGAGDMHIPSTIYVCEYVSSRASVCMCVYTYMLMYICKCTHIYVCVYVQHINIYMYVYTYACMYVYGEDLAEAPHKDYMHVLLHVKLYLYMHMYAHIHV
jgi:hypothetical protein